MTFGLPPGEQFSAIRWRGRTTICAPAIAATTWSGTGRRTRRPNCRGCSPTRAARTHAISIPPPLIRREAIAEMRAAAERLLAPQFRQIVRLIEEPILQPIYDLETPRMAFGRVAMRRRRGLRRASACRRRRVEGGRRRRGAGAGVAGGRRRRAARCKRFEAARLRENAASSSAPAISAPICRRPRREEERARAGRHSTDEAVIAETAVLDFLYV